MSIKIICIKAGLHTLYQHSHIIYGIEVPYIVFLDWCKYSTMRVKAGLKITAGHRTISGQDDQLSGQNLGLAVILTGHVRGFQTIN